MCVTGGRRCVSSAKHRESVQWQLQYAVRVTARTVCKVRNVRGEGKKADCRVHKVRLPKPGRRFTSIHVRRCSPFWVRASLKRRLYSPLSPARLFQPRIPRICSASLWTSGRQPVVRGPLMVREKMLVVRGEIWTLFAIFVFIILISKKQQQISL
jgi:hypothetical protein